MLQTADITPLQIDLLDEPVGPIRIKDMRCGPESIPGQDSSPLSIRNAIEN